jgi:hypothetical protein
MRRALTSSVATAAAAGVLAFAASVARAQVVADQPAAILMFPKILVDTSNGESERVDTLIRISNISDRPITLHCFYVNTNGHCRSQPAKICDPYTIGADNPCDPFDPCVPGWQETNFVVNITARQPVAWLASQGAALCNQSSNPDAPCFPLDDTRPGFEGQDNLDSRVPPVPETPFIGYLKCIAVDRNEVPEDRNDLIGVAEIITNTFDEGADTQLYDVRAVNAIGITAIPGQNDGDKTLVIGGGGCQGGERDGLPCEEDEECPGGGECRVAEYNGCPNVLILDHFFEGAADPVSGDIVNTKLTLVPCSEDFEAQIPTTATIQFLVFSEFEQRFSTSRSITCFQEFRLFDIDHSSEVRSIFSAAVNGTLTGQTRLRGVVGTKQCVGGNSDGNVCINDGNCPAGECRDNPRTGTTWVAIAEEFRTSQDPNESAPGSAAFNVHFHGSRPQSDFIHLP